jgi:hypothetical protein
MKRVSLTQKIDKCLKYGTIRTYSLEDAIQCYAKTSSDNKSLDLDKKNVRKAYKDGKVLCDWTPFDRDADFTRIMQLNTLPNFIKDIIIFEVTQ